MLKDTRLHMKQAWALHLIKFDYTQVMFNHVDLV